MSWPLPLEPVGRPWLAVAALAKRAALLPRSRRLLQADLGSGVVYVGEGESAAYLGRLHGAMAPPASSRTVVLADLARLLRSRPREELWYVELNRLLAPLLPAHARITHPWITQEVSLRGGAGQRTSRALEGVYGRRVRQHGLVCRLATDPASATAFYRELYLPYLRWRFADAAHPRPEAQLQRALRSGFLLQVWDRDRCLAGVVCWVARREVTALAFGLAAPYPELLRRGALSASSYFLIRWAETEGLETVNLLRSRPHLGDGVYEHKRRLGATPRWDPWPHTAIAVLPPAGAPLPLPAAGLLVRAGRGGVAVLAGAADQAAEGGGGMPRQRRSWAPPGGPR